MAVVTRLELRGSNGTDPFDKYPIAVNIPVSLNYNLADVRNPDQRKASFSKTINLNDKILEYKKFVMILN